jgi:hypothetical protein
MPPPLGSTCHAKNKTCTDDKYCGSNTPQRAGEKDTLTLKEPGISY